jgi:hypothetical protein
MIMMIIAYGRRFNNMGIKHVSLKVNDRVSELLKPFVWSYNLMLTWALTSKVTIFC